MIEYHRGMNPRQPYPTDLSEKEGDLIKHLVPDAEPGGRPEAYLKREILNGSFYLLRSDYSWRMLPHDLPPWRIVHTCPLKPGSLGTAMRGRLTLELPHALLPLPRGLGSTGHEGKERRERP
jgi:hypothetical protein